MFWALSTRRMFTSNGPAAPPAWQELIGHKSQIVESFGIVFLPFPRVRIIINYSLKDYILRNGLKAGLVGRRRLAIPPIPPGFRLALGEMYVFGEAIRRIRTMRLQNLRTKKREFDEQQKRWVESVSPTAQKLVGKCNPFFFRWLLRITNYDDIECADILENGAEVVGSKWLCATNKFGDLILNSMALAFIIQATGSKAPNVACVQRAG